MAAMATPRTRSAAIMTFLRSTRSETTPPARRKTTIGRVQATPTIESAVGAFESS